MRYCVILFLSVLGFALKAQIQQPVKWKFETNQNEEKATLRFIAEIEKGWHLYSQFVPEGGPIATEFRIKNGKEFKAISVVKEPKPEQHLDPNFNITLSYFSNRVVFEQAIEVASSNDFFITGEVEFMACDDKMCLPPEVVEFTFKVKGIKSEQNPIKDSVAKLEDGVDSNSQTLTTDTISLEIENKTQSSVTNQQKSLIGIFIAGFIGGLLALLTPCVFPMIPLTVSYFTKFSGSKTKGMAMALLYGLSIISIYTGLGLAITMLFGSDALNALASDGIVNILFFIVFVIFAISFLGAFEITLPSWLVNKADSASDSKGLGGIFFMAVTLSLVSFSCTGPIIGSLLVEAAVRGSIMGPAIGMLGFSLALALPFGIFAAFPGWLKALPKSGGWMNTVKVSLGFLELALALKFISVVDLAYHWEIITREVFLALWIAIFFSWGLYLLGIVRFSHDDDTTKISAGRGVFAVIVLSFVVYLIPGMFGAPLKIISGFPPPAFYSEGWNAGGKGVISNSIGDNVAQEHCPHNLNCFHDYFEALAHAKKVGKPLMIDFTGWSCVNCRKMEDQVWINPSVLKKLSNDYVLVSLYVDDKKLLPEKEQYVSSITGKKIKTVGNKWSDFQISRFNTNSQPYYVLVDHNEKLLVPPTAFNTNVDQYLEFLNSGLRAFSSKK